MKEVGEVKVCLCDCAAWWRSCNSGVSEHGGSHTLGSNFIRVRLDKGSDLAGQWVLKQKTCLKRMCAELTNVTNR